MRATVFLFNSELALWAVAKLALDRDAARALNREASIARIGLKLPAGYQRPALRAATIRDSFGVGIWDAVHESKQQSTGMRLRDISITVEGPAAVDASIFPDWVAGVTRLIDAHAPHSVSTTAKSVVQSCQRKPIHGDFTSANIVVGSGVTHVIDWENFHPSGPSLTDCVSQLLDSKRSTILPAAALRDAVSLTRQLPWAETIAATGYLAIHGDSFAQSVFEQLLLSKDLDLSDQSTAIQRIKHSNATAASRS